MFRVARKGFRTIRKGLRTSRKGFRVSRHGFRVSRKAFRMSRKGIREARKGTRVIREGFRGACRGIGERDSARGSARSYTGPMGRRSRILRVALVISLWLMVGAVVNVGVTWGLCAYPWEFNWRNSEHRHLWGGSWPFPYDGRLGKPSVIEGTESWYETSLIAAREKERWPRGTAYGVPFRSLGTFTSSLEWPQDKEFAWQIEVKGPVYIGLPLYPLWLGFAGNALCYGTAAWGVWNVLRAPLVLRRWMRRRAGRCIKCAYDLSGLPNGAACPECGAARPLID